MSQAQRTQKPKLIPFLHGKKLRTKKNYPPETIFLSESDYKALMKAQKEAQIPKSDLDRAARNIAKYREAKKEQQLLDLFPEETNIIFGIRSPRREKRKIAPGEEYKLVPFRNGAIARTKKNHPPGTILITLDEYNCILDAFKEGKVKESQLDSLARKLAENREPHEIEAIEAYLKQNPPPQPKPRPKKPAEDDYLYPLVNGERVTTGSAKTDYRGEDVLWITGKEYALVRDSGLGEPGLKALFEKVKNYRVPLVDGHRIPKSKVKEYPPEEVIYVRMKEYIEARMPIPSLSEIMCQQEDRIKALVKDVVGQTVERFVEEIIPESLSRHLSEAQLNAQKQELSYSLSETIKKQLYWELNQSWFDAKER